MDFNCPPHVICEQVLIEHCYGYPLSGQFVRIDYCYDIPRILHCHVNPANKRFFAGGFSKAVNDSVIARKTFAYAIDHTDNAQVIDVFTFATYGGICLGAGRRTASSRTSTSTASPSASTSSATTRSTATGRSPRARSSPTSPSRTGEVDEHPPDHHRRPGPHGDQQRRSVLRPQPGVSDARKRRRISCSSAARRS